MPRHYVSLVSQFDSLTKQTHSDP